MIGKFVKRWYNADSIISGSKRAKPKINTTDILNLDDLKRPLNEIRDNQDSFSEPIKLETKSSISSPSNIQFKNQIEEEEFINNLIESSFLNKDDAKGIEQSVQLENNSLKQLYQNWNLTSNQFLPLSNPLGSESTPFQFYKTHNSDLSILKHPRLSVTKLLVSSWCELREYYKIYAGSPIFEKSESMILGSEYHVKLEEETHEKIEISVNLTGMVLNNINEIRKIDGLERETISNEDELGKLWCDQIIYRLFSLITQSEAREILVHGYLNLNRNEIIENKNEVSSNDSVLISGIIDYLSIRNLENWNDRHLFNVIEEFLNQEEYINDVLIFDLPRFFIGIRDLISKYGNDYSLSISDIKTRKFPNIPKQKSVIDSAKLQTFYYNYFLKLLSSTSEFSYNSLIENAMRRGLDVDKPLGIYTTFEILINFYPLFLKDFKKMSNGEPIGFKQFDERESSENGKFDFGKFNFGKYFNYSENYANGIIDHSSFLNELSQADSMINFEKILLPLLKNWSTPITLRYLAARSSQFFEVLKQFKTPYTYVEYHYLRTGQTIETKMFDYDINELKDEVISASKFFNGSRKPIATTDKSKCKFCEFKSRCKIGSDYKGNDDIDEDSPKSNGLKIIDFLKNIEENKEIV
ncbi:unnamed protein product [Candida verbasci]|uniref:Exonuclease V, mitochondrial n=1 Tax=Candida verbasci TaxID=1227364 RepID=A0A9W4X8H2_9ASCO|nr:unnamed protein product [Candida verbasci]